MRKMRESLAWKAEAVMNQPIDPNSMLNEITPKNRQQRRLARAIRRQQQRAKKRGAA